ncbi:hypothetical protein ACFXPJ_00940 [Streptomyces goshikiensis]
MGDDTKVSRAWREPLEVITEAVLAIEPQLSTDDIAAAAAEAAQRKPGQRALANALLDDPDLLTSTRPAGPASLQRLILGLLKRGGQRVRPPRCGDCGRQKKLSNVHGTTRICSHCAALRRTVAEPCSVCGNTVQVAYRDPHGRPCCRKCPPGGGRDALEIIRDHVRQADPSLPDAAVTAAVLGLAPTTGQQRKIASTLESIPGLLTGDGAKGTPKVIALIEALQAAGSTAVTTPACPFCNRMVPLPFSRNRLRCCRRCYDVLRAKECSRCGQTTAIASHNPDGKPLCTQCTRKDVLNHEPCSRCGRIALIISRTSGEQLCNRCYTLPSAACSICGQLRPCFFATSDHPHCESCAGRLRKTTEQCVKCGNVRRVNARTADGGPMCWRCSYRPKPCGTCGKTKRVYGHAADGTPLCRSCYGKDPAARGDCRRCGVRERLHNHGRCHQCTAADQLRELLAGRGGTIRAEVEPLLTALEASDPKSVLAWLRRPVPRTLLSSLANDTGPITHDVLDRLPRQRAVQHIRSTLVAAGALNSRDEHLAALERWLAKALAAVTEPDERKIGRGFATWHHLRRLRKNPTNTYEQIQNARCEVRAAIQLLTWLRENGRTLATCTQFDIDRWVTEGPWLRHLARTFLLWAVEHRHARDVEVPLPAREDEMIGIEQTRRWELARRLFHDETIDLADRVAGLLVLLFAQHLSRIAALTIDHVTQPSGTVHLALGIKPLEMPPPLDELVLRLVKDRKGYAATGRTDDHPWLFPGAFAGRPISGKQLMRRLHRLGIRARPVRSTALLDLAAGLPAVVLSKLLGIHIRSATRWTQHSGASRNAYAADFSRRQRGELRKFQ